MPWLTNLQGVCYLLQLCEFQGSTSGYPQHHLSLQVALHPTPCYAGWLLPSLLGVSPTESICGLRTMTSQRKWNSTLVKAGVNPSFPSVLHRCKCLPSRMGQATCSVLLLLKRSLDRISSGLLIACKAAENWLCGQQSMAPSFTTDCSQRNLLQYLRLKLLWLWGGEEGRRVVLHVVQASNLKSS